MRMAGVVCIKKIEAGGPGSGRHPSGGPQAKSESILRRHGYEQVGGVPSKAIGNQYRTWGTEPSHGDSNWRHPDGHSATVNGGGWVTHDPGPKGRGAGFNLAVRSSDKINGYLHKVHASAMDAQKKMKHIKNKSLRRLSNRERRIGSTQQQGYIGRQYPEIKSGGLSSGVD